MTLAQIIKHYGTQAEAVRKTGFSRQSFLNWSRLGRVPIKAQELISFKSGGKLRAGKK